jgi:hypothetical protein
VPIEETYAKLLVKKVAGENAKQHMVALQAIADRNGGNRAVGTKGYDESAAYVALQLERAGYKVTLDPINFVEAWVENSPPVLAQTAPVAKTYVANTDFFTFQLSNFPVKNKVRFAFWAAEEVGLLGSDQYVEGLSAAERDQIRVYLNFDMVASPNYAYKLYDGDDSDATGAPAGPPGSAQIERQLANFFTSRGLATVGADFDGRSDYDPFIAVGIPAGGIFTGAEGIKTPAEAALFGGTAGVAYDVCYHQACDTIANPNLTALDVNADAIADSTARYAFDLTSIP